MLLSSAVRDRISFQRGKIVALSCVVAVWFASAVPASAALITVMPSSPTVTQGESVAVNFIVDELVGSLIFFKFSIEFDSVALAYNSDVSLGPAVDDPLFVPAFYDAADNPNVIQDNLGIPSTPLTGSPLLLHASFTATPTFLGETFIFAVFRFTQADVLLNELIQDEIFGPEAQDGDEVRFQGSVNVVAPPTTVPEPGTLLLLSTGMAASVVARRRRNRRGA